MRKSTKDEVRAYLLPLLESFERAAKEYLEISIDAEIMAGAPCVRGTRIPVYAIIRQESIEAALKAWPHLTQQQIEAAYGFAALVIACPVD